MLGIILAGGNGTRFDENGCCKSLLKINGKSLIEYALDNLIAMNVDKAIIVVGKYRDEIKAALGTEYHGIALNYALQETPMGCIHALYCAMTNWNGETVVLQLSDEIYCGFNAHAVEKASDVDFACGYITVKNNEEVKENYSIFCDGDSDRLVRCEEKSMNAGNNKKGTGLCIFNPACMSLLKNRYAYAGDHFVSLCDFMNNLIADGKKGLAIPIADEEININTPEKLEYAKQALKRRNEHE